MDTWADLRSCVRAAPDGTPTEPGPERTRLAPGVAGGRAVVRRWTVNLHDWIDELMDALDIEIEVDEGLVLDVAREAAHNVERPAAPITHVPARLRRRARRGRPRGGRGAGRPRRSALAERWEGGEDLEAATPRSTRSSWSSDADAASTPTEAVDALPRLGACAPSSPPSPVAPRSSTLAELPDPEPGPGEVVLDVVATAVNRADLLQRQGLYPPPPGRLRRHRPRVQRHRRRASARASTGWRSATRSARCSPAAGTPRRWPSPPAS